MAESNPFFSIIVPCYNQGHFLTTAIESVRSQNFQEWELIVVNDGSSDATKAIGENFSTIDNRILVINQSNSGLSSARNAGLGIARGRIINFLDADDWLLDDCLAVVAHAFRNDRVDCLVGGFEYHLDNVILHVHNFHSVEIDGDQIKSGNLAPPAAFFIRDRVARAIGRFDASLKSCEDWDYWIRGVKMGFNFNGIANVLVAYRFVMGSMSKQPRQMFEALCEVSRRAIDDMPPSEGASRTSAIDLSEIAKVNFLKCLGVSLHQGKVEESVMWYKEECHRHDWTFTFGDWKALSSNLSFKYFNSLELIRRLISGTFPTVRCFLQKIGYSEKETSKILQSVFLPQLMMLNHIKYGKIVGAVVNKMKY